MSNLILPLTFIVAWICALTGVTPPGYLLGETANINYLRWILFFSGIVFLISSIMHSVFAKRLAKSIGWQTNGFQYELAAVSFGLGLGCLYACYHRKDAWIAISLPVITFLFLAGVNHVKEIICNKNYAPNNIWILIWDFGISISLTALLVTLG